MDKWDQYISAADQIGRISVKYDPLFSDKVKEIISEEDMKLLRESIETFRRMSKELHSEENKKIRK